MFFKLLSKLLDTKVETLEFILDKKSGVYRKLAVILPLSFWGTVLSIISPLFLKWTLDAITGKWVNLEAGSIKIEFGDTFKVALAILGGGLCLGILNQFFWYLRNRISEVLNFQTNSYLEDKFNNYLQKFDSSFLGAENNLRLVRNLQWSLNGIQESFLRLFQLLLEIPISLIGMIAVVQFLHPWLMVLIIIFTVIFMLIDAYKTRVWRQYEIMENRQGEQKNQLNWKIVNQFNNFLTNGWLDNIYKYYVIKRERWFATKLKQSKNDLNISFFSSILYEFSQFVNSAAAVFLVLTNAITIGTLTVFGFYGERIKELINKVGDLFKLLVEMRYNLFRLTFLLNIKPKLDYSNIKPFEYPDVESIRFDKVNFTYPQFFEDEKEYLNSIQSRLGVLKEKQTNPLKKLLQFSTSMWSNNELVKEIDELKNMFESAAKNKKILNEISFELKEGKIYALVGYNGAGKTTLTRLIKRTLDSTDGDIYINDRKIKTIDPLLIKNYISSLEQNSYLVESLTVKENILMGADNEVNDEEIWHILKQFELDKTITSLDQIIGEGVSFSGGQAQLLELTRVLLSPKPIVILDEGTNQLDAIKEAKVMELIKQYTRNSIVIFITHRMTTCIKCDEVIVLDSGKLQVSGKPDDLLNSQNLFRTFWDIQVKNKSETDNRN
ncbi:MAG: ATP-binding cassette domain-containing protein [Patescibacteria group bacterium]